MAKRKPSVSFEEAASELIALQEVVSEACDKIDANYFDPETRQNTADTLDRCLSLMIRDMSEAKVRMMSIQRTLRQNAELAALQKRQEPGR